MANSNIFSVASMLFILLLPLARPSNLPHCIPEDIVFVCIRVNSVNDLSYSATHHIYASLSLQYLNPTTSSISTQSITSKTTTSTNIDDINLIACVPTYQSRVDSVSGLYVAFRNRDDNDAIIGTLAITDLSNADFNISSLRINTSPTSFTLTDTPYFASSVLSSTVDVSLSIWLTNSCVIVTCICFLEHVHTINISISDSAKQTGRCMQIVGGSMFAKDNYMLSVQLNGGVKLDAQAITNAYGDASWNNAYLCLPGSSSSTTGLITGEFALYSTTQFAGETSGDIEYNIVGINSNEQFTEYQACQYMNGSELTLINFKIGEVSVLYIPSCTWTDSQCDLTSSSSLSTIIDTTAVNIIFVVFISILLFFSVVVLVMASYTSKNTYKQSDPVKFDYIIFFIVFLWTSVSQVMFIVYLVGIVQENGNSTAIQSIFYVCFTLLVLSYILNIIALTHYLQIYNHAFAPGISRHWLQYWSWFLIILCVLFGNVNIGLELCNSLVLPMDIFAMHLPRSQVVNCRVNRFWTNSVIVDLPFFLIICIFLIVIDSEFKVIIWNTLFICMVSFLITVIFAYLRKSYSTKDPIALYRFSFTFKSNLFESYFIHSHHRIKQAFAELIGLRKPSLVIIDQCSEIVDCMKVEGRILKDTKKSFDDSQWRAMQNVQRNSQRLRRLLAEQFGLLNDQLDVKNFQFVRMRAEHGELVYDYDTAVKKFIQCRQCRTKQQEPPK